MDKFKVVIDKQLSFNETYLKVTHNGYQWSTIRIDDAVKEIPLIITELQRHLTAVQAGRAESGGCQDCKIYHRRGWQCDECGTKPPAT